MEKKGSRGQPWLWASHRRERSVLSSAWTRSWCPSDAEPRLPCPHPRVGGLWAQPSPTLLSVREASLRHLVDQRVQALSTHGFALLRPGSWCSGSARARGTRRSFWKQTAQRVYPGVTAPLWQTAVPHSASRGFLVRAPARIQGTGLGPSPAGDLDRGSDSRGCVCV